MLRIAALVTVTLLSSYPQDSLDYPEGTPPIEISPAVSPVARAETRPEGGCRRRSRLALDPLASLRACGCLRCKVIAVVLEDQHDKHNGKWSNAEVWHGLAEAAAYFCQEVQDQAGDQAGDPVGDLATLVSAKLSERSTRLSGADPATKGTVH